MNFQFTKEKALYYVNRRKYGMVGLAGQSQTEIGSGGNRDHNQENRTCDAIGGADVIGSIGGRV